MYGAMFDLNSAIVDGALPSSVSYFGMPSNTGIMLRSNTSFTGTIYAPEADMLVGNGSQYGIDFYGSCQVKSLKLTGRFNLHFDEALAKGTSMVIRGYAAKSWREL